MFSSDYFASEKAFRAMLPGKIAMTAIRLAEAERISPLDALGRFYASETYRVLEDESSKSWWESPRELARDFALAPKIEHEEHRRAFEASRGIVKTDARTDELVASMRGC